MEGIFWALTHLIFMENGCLVKANYKEYCFSLIFYIHTYLDSIFL